MPLSRAAAVLLVFAVSLLFWVVVLAAAGRAGLPAKLVLSEDCHRPRFELARRMFEVGDVSNVDYLVLGTKQFVTQVTNRINRRDHIVVGVAFGAPSPRQYAQGMRVFAHSSKTRVIVQNVPHFWTNYDETYVRGDQAWLGPTQYPAPASTYAAALENLRITVELLSTSCQPAKRARLRDEFLWTRFLPTEDLRHTLQEFPTELGEVVRVSSPTDIVQQSSELLVQGPAEDSIDVVWVFDADWIPDDALHETRAAIREFARGPRHVDGHGLFISIDRLDDVLAGWQ